MNQYYRRKMQFIGVFSCLLALFIVMQPPQALAEDSAAFEMSSLQQSALIGDHVQVKIKAENVTALYGYEFVVKYDPAMLEYESSESLMEGPGMPAEHIDNGVLSYAYSKYGSEEKGFSGSGDLAQLNFKAKKDGSAVIELVSLTYMNDADARFEFDQLHAQAIVTVKPSGGSQAGGGTPSNSVTNGIVILNGSIAPGSTRVAASISNLALDNALSGAITNPAGKKEIKIEVGAHAEATAYDVRIPLSYVTAANQGHVLELVTEFATIQLPGDMLHNLVSQTDKELLVKVEKRSSSQFNSHVLTASIGNRPMIDASLELDGKPLSHLEFHAPVSIEIPYKPSAAESADPSFIKIWYIQDNGSWTPIEPSQYVSDKHAVEFTTNHFSTYAVTYYEGFKDLADFGWAEKEIRFLRANGIINGVTDSEFSPQANITRADFVSLLIRSLGLSAALDTNFDDIARTDYFYTEVGMAKSLGIIEGTGDNRFNPREFISRQDMMVMTAKALLHAKLLSSATDISILDEYKDQIAIADYAKLSVSRLVKSNLIQGSDGLLLPESQTRRAEAAVLIHRIYELQH